MPRNIWLITKKELAIFFQSWLGYVIISVSLLALGVLYEIYPLNNKSNTELMSAELLHRFFYFFSGVSMVACWIVPTRLFVEEQQAGTLVLLLSSPLKETEIVLGKYLSSVIFMGVLLILSLYIPLDIYIEGKISIMHLLSGYFGLFLWSLVCTAIGLFYSAITKYQIIAFMLTLVTSLILIFSPLIGNTTSGIWKEIFVYVGLYNTHLANFSRGQLHLKDIFYFTSLVIFLLAITSKIIEARRWK